jgi:D-alanine-D-alanine ligase-like ATP-grasp enzyme
VWRNRNITSHPETGEPLASIKIPEWKYILEMSVKAAKCVELGYLGADIVIDRHLGPLVMELNARPGLTIQLANKKGLVKKLYGEKES